MGSCRPDRRPLTESGTTWTAKVSCCEVESEGYQAISKLREMPDTNSYTIYQMALIKKENGAVKVCESYDSGVNTTDSALKGGLIGGLVGILGGPIGVLLMSSYGLAAGSLVDMGDALDGASMIETVVDKLGDSVALVIFADERNESVLDAHLADQFKVEIRRYNAEAVAKEVEEAVLMEEEMARQARLNLRKDVKSDLKQNADETKAQINETKDQIKTAVEEAKDEIKTTLAEAKENLKKMVE